jgi:catalase
VWIMSDRAIPRSFRFIEGFGVHTFRLVNAEGRSTFVKFHWKPKLGLQSVVWNEALKINGADPDFHRRDLWDAITQGDFPEWELGLQLFDDEFADRFAFDVLDPTKIIPEEEVPVRRVGRLVLDRMPENFFATPSRWRSAPRMSCPASTSPTTRCCRAATSPTWTPSSSGWAAPTSPICRSTRPSAPSRTSSRTGTWL